MTDILKNEWGFKGYVLSDWGGIHNTVESANAGMDMEMPSSNHFGKHLLEAVKAGKVSRGQIDDKARRILRAMIGAGLFDRLAEIDAGAPENPEHHALALEVARESMELLKNRKKLLPLNRDRIRSIAVIGPHAGEASLGGWGSGMVPTHYGVSPLEGILKKVGDRVDVRYQKGCDVSLPGDYEAIPASSLIPPGGFEGKYGLRGEYFANLELKDEPVLTHIDPQIDFNYSLLNSGNYKTGDPLPGIEVRGGSVRWTGQLVPPVSGQYQFGAFVQGRCRLFINDQVVIDSWDKQAREGVSGSMTLESGSTYDI